MEPIDEPADAVVEDQLSDLLCAVSYQDHLPVFTGWLPTRLLRDESAQALLLLETAFSALGLFLEVLQRTCPHLLVEQAQRQLL